MSLRFLPRMTPHSYTWASPGRLLRCGALLLAATCASQAGELRADSPLPANMAAVFGLPEGFSGPGANELKEAFDKFVTGDGDNALDKLKIAEGKNPRLLPPARVMLARMLFAANRTDMARAQLEQAAVDHPMNPDVYLLLGNLALAEGRLTDAHLQFQHALLQLGADAGSTALSEEQKPTLRLLYYGLTTVAERRMLWERARSWATLWQNVAGPDDKAQALARLALANFFLDDLKPTEGLRKVSEDLIMQATQLDPNLDPPKVILSNWATQKGDDKAAEEYITQAVAEAPKDARVHSAISMFYLNRNELEKAEQHAQQATSLDASSDALKRLRGTIFLHRKNFNEASKIFRELYQKSPSDVMAVNFLALSLGELGGEANLRQAQELAEINARQYPRSGEALATLGRIYYLQNRQADAEQALTAAARNGSITPDAAYFLARLMGAKGQLNEAQRYLEAAVDSRGRFIFRDDAEIWLNSLRGSDGSRILNPTSDPSATSPLTPLPTVTPPPVIAPSPETTPAPGVPAP